MSNETNTANICSELVRYSDTVHSGASRAMRNAEHVLLSQARQIEALTQGLTQGLTEARAEIAECDALRADMAAILRAVAVAVRGPEVDGISWGWADLPDRVTAAVNMMSGAVELARDHAATIEALTAERDEARRMFYASCEAAAAFAVALGLDETENDPSDIADAIDELTAERDALKHGHRSQHDADSAELRRLCAERDELRRRLDAATPATPAPGEWIKLQDGQEAPLHSCKIQTLVTQDGRVSFYRLLP